MCDVDGIDGGDSRPVRRTRQGSKSAQVSEPYCDSIVCYGCELNKPFGKTYKGCDFCWECMAGLRARHRSLRDRGGPTAVTADGEEMRKEPEVWRPKFLPFVDPATRSLARQSAKAEVNKKYEDECTLELNMNFRDKIWLNERHYCKHVKDWDDVPKEQALKDFAKLLKEQKGNDEVWVYDHKRERVGEGIEKRSGNRRARISADDDDDGGDSLGRSRSRSPSRRTRSSRVSFTSGRGAQGSSATGRQGRGGSRGGGGGRRAVGRRPPAVDVGGDGDEDMEGYNKLAEKEGLKRPVDQLKTDVTFTMKKLNDTNDQATSKKVRQHDLPHTFSKMRADLLQIQKVAEGFHAKIDGASVDDVPDLRAELNIQIKHQAKVLSAVNETAKCIALKLASTRTRDRADYQSLRWCSTKATAALVAGNYGKMCGKFFGSAIGERVSKMKSVEHSPASPPDSPEKGGESDPLPNATLAEDATLILHVHKDSASCAVQDATQEDFDFSKVNVWRDGTAHPMFADLNRFLAEESTSAIISTKVANLNDALKVNGDWPSSFGCVPDMGIASFNGKALVGSDLPGNTLWVLNNRTFKKRFGPSCTCCPGVAQLLRPLTGSIYVCAFPIEPILSQGIAIPQVERFFETEGGKEFLSSTSIVIHVPLGSWAYVPTGFATFAVYCKEPPPRAKKTDLYAGAYVSYTLFLKDEIDRLAPATKQAIMKWNTDHFDTKATKDMWRKRRAVWDAAFQ